jgi:hypothetical protein
MSCFNSVIEKITYWGPSYFVDLILFHLCLLMSLSFYVSAQLRRWITNHYISMCSCLPVSLNRKRGTHGNPVNSDSSTEFHGDIGDIKHLEHSSRPLGKSEGINWSRCERLELTDMAEEVWTPTEPSGPIQVAMLLEELSAYQILRMGPDSW